MVELWPLETNATAHSPHYICFHAARSTLGEALSKRLGWDFKDGDDFHPEKNVTKMSQGIPLTDEDRVPWLQAIRDVMKR